MEYLLLFVEFHLVKRKSILWLLLMCLGIGLSVYCFMDNELFLNNINEFNSTIINVLGILIGFTISAFAMFLSIDNENIDKAKNEKLDVKLYSHKISLYDSVFIGLAYVVIMQGFVLIANFIYPLFVDAGCVLGKILFSIDISLLSYIILLLLRNVLDFYFILTKKNSSSS